MRKLYASIIAFIGAEIAKWCPVLQKAGMKAQ